MSQAIADAPVQPDARFRPRGREVSRIEGFSDTVFGFSLTLLVVSLEVPQDFAQLRASMTGAVAFAASFAMLVWIWYEHHAFFRRFGLGDGITITLNAALLFVVVLYIYPLKFVFTHLSRLVLGVPPVPAGMERPTILASEVPSLMIIYGIGFVAVFVIFAAMHWRALSLAGQLDLTPCERHDAITWMGAHLLMVAVGVVSVAITVAAPRQAPMAGLLYWAIGPLQAAHGIWRGRLRERRFRPRPAPLVNGEENAG